MTIPLWCLLGFAAWTLLLVVAVIGWRSAEVLLGRRRANEFTGGVPHGGALYWRLNRAHLNAAENLPLIAAVVLVAHVAGHRSAAFDTLAVVHLGARVAQSSFHVASNAVPVALLRFSALVVQLACLAGMIGLLVASHA